MNENPFVEFSLAIAGVIGARFGHQVNDVVEVIKFGAAMLDTADDIPPEFEELTAEVKALAASGAGLAPERIAEFREMRKNISASISDHRERREAEAAADDGTVGPNPPDSGAGNGGPNPPDTGGQE